jgi:hypothetical protein
MAPPVPHTPLPPSAKTIYRCSWLDTGEMNRRREALRQVMADARPEGQISTPEGKKILQAFVKGEIDLDELAVQIEALHAQR